MKILILEDNQSVADLIGSNLSDQINDVNINYATNYDDAFVLCYDNTYDYMIIDLKLADMDKTGADFARRIRQAIPDQSIILITGMDLVDLKIPLDGIYENALIEKTDPKTFIADLIGVIMHGNSPDLKLVQDRLNRHDKKFESIDDSIERLSQKSTNHEIAITELATTQREFIESGAKKQVLTIVLTVLLAVGGGTTGLLFFLNQSFDTKLSKMQDKFEKHAQIIYQIIGQTKGISDLKQMELNHEPQNQIEEINGSSETGHRNELPQRREPLEKGLLNGTALVSRNFIYPDKEHMEEN